MIMNAAEQDGVNADSVGRADEHPNLSDTRFPASDPTPNPDTQFPARRLTSNPEGTDGASHVSGLENDVVYFTFKDEAFKGCNRITFTDIEPSKEAKRIEDDKSQGEAGKPSGEAEEQKESWLRRNLRFSTQHFWKKAGVVILGTLSLFHFAAKTHKAMKLDAVREQATTPYKEGEQNHFISKHQWSENSKRYAGTSQEVAGMSWVSYTGNLESAMRSGNFNSLEEAHSYLEQQGVSGLFHYSPQLPVSSSGSDLGWKIGEAQDRRVIIIQGEGHAGGVVLHALGAADGQTFSRDAQRMKSIARDVFDVAEEHIHHLNAPTVKEVEALLKKIGETSNSDTEVMLYYVGHALANEASARGSGQGAYNGTLCLGENDGLLSEDELKDMSVTHMSGVKTFSVVLDACYTGSFIY